MGRRRTQPNEGFKSRVRQNVVFELGFFAGRLGRERVVALYREQEGFEMPLGYSGVRLVPFDAAGGWQVDLVRALQAAKYPVDPNRLREE
jgi:predicted nucleotide-binding protein